MREAKLKRLLHELEIETAGYPMHIRDLYNQLVKEIEIQHAEWEAEENQ